MDPAIGGEQDAGWLELLANGLTFDLTGLAPADPSGLPPIRHRYGFSQECPQTEETVEAICLSPGPHLAGGRTIVPVLRWMAMLAAELAKLPSAIGVLWHGAAALSTPDHFRSSVMAWVEGGAFPGLALTALADDPDGGMRSEGLDLFTGQELHLPALLCQDRASAAKLALRLVDWLVAHGRVGGTVEFTGPDGSVLNVEAVRDGKVLRVSKHPQ